MLKMNSTFIMPLLPMTIKRGNILHSCDIKGINHGKFFVVLNIVDNHLVGFFFINSIVNRYIEDKPGILELQFIMRPSKYSFLKHDSFVNGANIEELPLSVIEKQLSEGIATIVDNMRSEDMEDLMDLCRKSPLFKPRQKKRYFYNS